MRRIRTTGLCLLALLASSAAAAVSASASAPEFGRCIKKAAAGGAGYSDAGCTKAVGTGAKYEWSPGPGAKGKFTRRSKEGALVTFTAKEKLVCNGETATGEYTGPSSVGGVVIAFTGCEQTKRKCESAGQAEGTIVLKTMEGTLGIIKRAFVEGKEVSSKNKVGFDLFAAGNKDGELVEFSCAGIPSKWRGSIITPVTSNKMSMTATYKQGCVKGKQGTERFEGEPTDVIEQSIAGTPFEPLCWLLTTTQTSEEKIEVNSVV